ncbi:MAG TPA: hypothetical protein VMU28_05740 [Terriglobales bacterium]|nr:hypothetical protein [Terriglobales bacterium]
MKKLALLVGVVLLFALVATPVFAQEHVDVGVYADYVNLSRINQGFWGIGGRVGVGLAPHFAVEANMAYDFSQSFSTPNSFGFTNTANLHMLHGTFGPKLYTDFGPVRVFGVLEGGFIRFSGGPGGSLAGFTGIFQNFNTTSTNGVFYPAVGFELGHHWIGLRAEAGDLIYFSNGAVSNINVRVGPEFTF